MVATTKQIYFTAESLAELEKAKKKAGLNNNSKIVFKALKEFNEKKPSDN